MKNLIVLIGIFLTIYAQANDQNLLIEGRFGSAEGCSVAVKGVISGSLKTVLYCVEDTSKIKFTNGATEMALTDGSDYLISATIVGQYKDTISISEVALFNE